MSETFTDKMGKVTSNLQYMAGLNAPESDVKAYMDAVGVTGAHLRQYNAILQAQSNQEKPSALARFGRGMQDVASGIGQLTGTLPTVQAGLAMLPGGTDIAATPELFGQTDPQANDQELAAVNQYEQATGPGMDWMRLGGQAVGTAPLAFAPAATAGLAARMGTGAMAGGAGGMSLYAKDGEERIANTASGLLGGGLFAGVAPAVAKAGGKIISAGRDAVDTVSGLLASRAKVTTTITREIESAAKNAGVSLDDIGEAYVTRVKDKAAAALRNNEPFDYDAAVRQARAERFGFADDAALTRGQATRDPAVYSMEKNLSKRPQGAILAERMNNQLARAESYMDRLAKTPDLDAVTAGDAMRGLAGARADAMQADVRALYDAVPKGGEFSANALADRTAQVLADFRDDVSSGVKTRIDEILDGKRAFTADELIGLDKLISQTMPPNPTNAARGTAAGKLKEALLGVMDDATGAAPAETKAAYAAAKKAAKARFDAIGPHNGLVAQLVHGTIDPTRVIGKIAIGGIDDLRRLNKFMKPEQWATVQRSVENMIAEDARPGGEFGQAAYDRVIKRIGKARLSVIFGPEKAKELIDFRDVARDVFRYPNFHTINVSNTAPEAANIVGDLANGLADLVPGGRLAAGLLNTAGKDRAGRKAEKETAEIVMGLLSGQPRRSPRTNPVVPALPYIRAAAPAAGLLTVEGMRR